MASSMSDVLGKNCTKSDHCYCIAKGDAKQSIFVTTQACHCEPPHLFFGGEAIPKNSVIPVFNKDCFTRCGTLVRDDIVYYRRMLLCQDQKNTLAGVSQAKNPSGQTAMPALLAASHNSRS